MDEAKKLLQKVLDSADSDWWAERADMTRETKIEVELTVGLLEDIYRFLRGD